MALANDIVIGIDKVLVAKLPDALFTLFHSGPICMDGLFIEEQSSPSCIACAIVKALLYFSNITTFSNFILHKNFIKKGTCIIW